MTAEEIQHIRWAGWGVLGVILLGWAGWLSLLAIATRSDVDSNTERTELHYEILRDQVTEIRTDVKTLLQRDNVARTAP
jgi:hypothetical protein